MAPALFGIAFAVFVGIIAGYFPSKACNENKCTRGNKDGVVFSTCYMVLKIV